MAAARPRQRPRRARRLDPPAPGPAARTAISPSGLETARASQRRPAEAMRLPLPDRLFLGGLRNLLAGVAAVVHHEADHRSLSRDDFPVRVQRALRLRAFAGPRARSCARPIARPIGASPGSCAPPPGPTSAAKGELDRLAEANVLRQNTVIVHGTALDARRRASPRRGRRRRRLVPRGGRAPLRGAAAHRAPCGRRESAWPWAAAAPPSGGRDLLSALAAARRDGLVDDAELLDLATAGGARGRAVAPGRSHGGGGGRPHRRSPDRERLLAGSRTAVQLVIVGGAARLWRARAPPARLEPGATSTSRSTGRRAPCAAPLRRRLRASAARAGSADRPRWLEGVML